MGGCSPKRGRSFRETGEICAPTRGWHQRWSHPPSRAARRGVGGGARWRSFHGITGVPALLRALRARRSSGASPQCSPLRSERSDACVAPGAREGAQPHARKFVELADLGTIRSRSAIEAGPTTADRTGACCPSASARAAQRPRPSVRKKDFSAFSTQTTPTEPSHDQLPRNVTTVMSAIRSINPKAWIFASTRALGLRRVMAS